MAMHKDTAALRWTLGPLGLVAVIILAVVSATMNYRFGYSLGKTDTDGQIYALAAVGADILKMASPFFFFAAIAARAWGVTTAAALVWVVTTAFALTGALGHAALNRLDTTGQRVLASTAYKDLRDDLKRYQGELSWVPPHRPVAAVKADMEALKAQRLWSTTAECQVTAGRAARTFCSQYHKLDGELGAALQAQKLNTKIEEVRAKLANTKSEAAMSDADPQAAVLSRVLGIDISVVVSGLILLVVLLLETCSGLGPYVVLRYMFARPRLPLDLETRAVEADPPSAAAVAEREAPMALPAPEAEAHAGEEDQTEHEAARVHPSKLPPPSQEPRQPLPGSVQSLIGIGFPLTRPSGPERPRETAKAAAYRFSVWAKAMGLHGQYSPGDLYQLYREFARADHRQPVPYNALAANLENRGNGISKTRPITDGKQSVVWVISPGRFNKAARQAPEPKPAADDAKEDVPAAEGLAVYPFPSAASGGASPAAALVRTAPRLPEKGEPAWLHANRKAMRRWRIEQRRKQRKAHIRRAA